MSKSNDSKWQSRSKLLAIFMVTVLCFSAIMIVASESTSASERKVKNVIIMIPDGCGSTHTTLARWYSGESLALDQMPSGLVRTYAGESIIVDSAPAGTAYCHWHQDQ